MVRLTCVRAVAGLRNSCGPSPALPSRPHRTPGDWPELDLLTYGTPIPVALRTAAADRHVTLVLDRGVAMVDGTPSYAHTVNG